MNNPNSELDPQDEMSSLAHMSPEDCAEYESWLDLVATRESGETCQH